MREIERRAQREGLPAPKSRIVEHLTYALSADPNYHRAALKLCDIMSHQLETHNYDFILRNLLRLVTHNEAISLIVVQSLARLNRRAEAELHLNTIIEKYPKNGLFWLMRGCLRTDEKQAARDLDEAKYLLGNDFHGCRSAVDNAFISVTGV
jgi:lipopolysaccharide biosynthesis regulator YciM